MLKKTLIMLVCAGVLIPLSAQSQTYDLDYFVKKWSRQQQGAVEKIIGSWLTGESQVLISNYVVDLVRIEALMASSQSAVATLYLPELANATPVEVPGRLLEMILVKNDLPFGSETFFAGREFSVKPFKNREDQLAELSNATASNVTEVSDGTD